MNKQNKVRIGLVLPNTPNYSETFFNSKIKGLQDNKYEVVLFSKGKSRRIHSSCKTVFAPDFTIKFNLVIEFFHILKNCLLNFKTALKLYELNKKDGLTSKTAFKNVLINSYILRFKLDWLHFGFGTMALQSENVAEAIGAKMAVSFRGFDMYIYPIKFPNCYDLLFSKLVKYHVLSNEMKQTLIEKNIKNDFIVKITPAIDTDSFTSDDTKQNYDVFQFLTIGRLHWKKGIDYILDALAIIKKSGISFHYTIIGEGVEKEKLMFAVHQLGLIDNVTFIGKIPHSEVKNYLQKSSFYIQYSVQEGFCNAVIEAQAMGLLCIVSDADGLSENVLHEETGWVVPKRDPILLAQKINEVIKLSETNQSEIRKKAIERVKKEFDIAKQNVAFKQFYSDLMK
jgi:colanic acid/amylovoran biosynthesis glycosyltransferase